MYDLRPRAHTTSLYLQKTTIIIKLLVSLELSSGFKILEATVVYFYSFIFKLCSGVLVRSDNRFSPINEDNNEDSLSYVTEKNDTGNTSVYSSIKLFIALSIQNVIHPS